MHTSAPEGLSEPLRGSRTAWWPPQTGAVKTTDGPCHAHQGRDGSYAAAHAGVQRARTGPHRRRRWPRRRARAQGHHRTGAPSATAPGPGTTPPPAQPPHRLVRPPHRRRQPGPPGVAGPRPHAPAPARPAATPPAAKAPPPLAPARSQPPARTTHPARTTARRGQSRHARHAHQHLIARYPVDSRPSLLEWVAESHLLAWYVRVNIAGPAANRSSLYIDFEPPPASGGSVVVGGHAPIRARRS